MLAALLALPVAHYIRRHRDRLHQTATPLSTREKTAMAPYFHAELLDQVRIAQRDPLPIPNPPFTRLIQQLGFDYPDLSLTAAITFGHLIATRSPMSHSLLFHELVHVVQYRQLGVAAFARQYVQGILTHRAYEKIPLEACAFQLEARFQLSRQPFNVESEVAASLKRFI